MNNERDKIIKDLDRTFKLALDAGDYKAAIQAKQIVCKLKGLIDAKKTSLSLIELSANELDALINEAENINKWQ